MIHTAIDLLRQAIFRTEEEMHTMSSELDGSECCPGCALGRPYLDLEKKKDRQEAWLTVLLARKSGDQLALKQASEKYANLTRESK